jgi:hypothetical protein
MASNKNIPSIKQIDIYYEGRDNEVKLKMGEQSDNSSFRSRASYIENRYADENINSGRYSTSSKAANKAQALFVAKNNTFLHNTLHKPPLDSKFQLGSFTK